MPAFLSAPFATIEDVFPNSRSLLPLFARHEPGVLSLAPRTIQFPNGPQPLIDVQQAGRLAGLLIDQHGRPVFYSIHMNDSFVSFIHTNGLLTPAAIKSANPMLSPPPGVLEMKAAWMVVDSPAAAANYITVPARIPRFSVKNGQLTVDQASPPLKVVVALLALHVVFTLPGHPEMIWSTFEHVDDSDPNRLALRDNAPAAEANPRPNAAPTVVAASGAFPLYKIGTLSTDANKPLTQAALATAFDSASQTFSNGVNISSTSVYRPYPGSKTDGHKPGDSDEDDEVIRINTNMQNLFRQANLPPSDARRHYELVGAVWLDSPLGPDPTNTGQTLFRPGKSFRIRNDQSTDDATSELAGEGRLASTAMESFTENATSPGTFEPNCFSCHDTNAVFSNDSTVQYVSAKLLNVSHIMSKVASEQIPRELLVK